MYAVHNSFFLFGGKLANNETAQDSLWQLDFTTLQWEEFSGSSTHFSVCDMFPCSNGLVIVGGSTEELLEAMYYSFTSKTYNKIDIDF
jgi:uncharacterized protein YuzB (UPF0349 family)